MAEALAKARDAAKRFRFSGDVPGADHIGFIAPTRNLASALFQNELEIAPEVTPGLAAQLNQVCDHLAIPRDRIHAFVYPDAEPQAACYASSTSECVIRFSSGLVDLLDSAEFGFVCGHELGHFLLGHGVVHDRKVKASVEQLMVQRAMEISADRVGLVACSSLEVSLRALMKTASGLNSEHLRFDVRTFIGQLQKTPESVLGRNIMASHPSMFVRCRALLWMSLCDSMSGPTCAIDEKELATLDERVRRDFHKYVDGPANRRIEEALDVFALWMAAQSIVEDGIFRKREQACFTELFGEEKLEQMLRLLSNTRREDVQSIVKERVVAARRELEALIPNRLAHEVKRIEGMIRSRFI